MTYQNGSFSTLIIVLIFSFLSCEKDNNSDQLQGEVEVEITDAPVDDAGVQAVFVTIADVRIDGQSLNGYSKTSLDIMAYQNGNTELLGALDLDAKTYSNITLVLDYETDASGNSPGCYVLDENGNKQPVRSTSDEVRISNNFDIIANQTTKLLIDFDLRKCLTREDSPTQQDEYEFVSSSRFNSSLRLVNRNESGVIAGNCQDFVSNSETLVVFAYRKGTYNRDNEVSGENDLTFQGAVTSAVVANNGDYELHFLEAGDYEIHFAAFKDEDNDGTTELQGTLLLDAITSIDLGAIKVDAQATVTANVIVTGIIPL
ncbi:DUF4382 domain-containing protein [Lewinella cohaerens]|uniref:DUF4382 domain-containing protein n=1 Tax=Lewinella cohaerens TaxID=70995 RepID=UPI00037C0472|nr:DUF4382 domain-containing protein [Lewinella cohaerens]